MGGTYTSGAAGGAYRGGSYTGGSATVNTNVNVNQGWGAYNGPGWGGVAAGAAAGLAVGATVASLPAGAAPVVVSDQNYYVVGSTYYQPCFTGAVKSYWSSARLHLMRELPDVNLPVSDPPVAELGDML